jgi:hypothetical protein
MRRRGVLCLIGAIATIVGFGDVNAARSQEVAVSTNLANQLRYVQVGIKSGRVNATSSFPGRTFNLSTNANDRREQMTLDLTGPQPSLDYELTTASFRIVVDLDHGNTLRIRRDPQGDAKTQPLEFYQPADGTLTIKLGDKTNERTITADSLWHLFAAEPDLARNEIEPLLRLLKPAWPIGLQFQGIEELLYRKVDAERNYDRQAWTELVKQLSGEHYIDRLEADRRLRDLGKIVIPYLRNLDLRQLDAEQAFRIRMIVRSYGSDDDEDTPDAAADWLAADPEIWYSLAARAVGPQRTKVRTQLALILGEPVVLDDDTTGEKLQMQLAKIREHVSRGKRPVTSTK